MKPAVLNILAFTFLFVSAVSSNKSDTVNNTPEKSTILLLTQSSWKLQSVGIDADKNGVAEMDATSSIQPCTLDNTYTFKTDSTGTMDEAALKCTDTDPQSKPFTWFFKDNQAVLSGTFSFTNGDATIVSMNDTKLVVTYDDDFGTGTPYHILAALQH